MDEFVTFIILALIGGYILNAIFLAILERFGLKYELIAASTIAIVIGVAWLAFTIDSYSVQNQPLLSIFNVLLILLVPFSIFIALNQKIIKIENKYKRHLALLGIVVIIVTIFPVFTLVVSCSTGLDCI